MHIERIILPGLPAAFSNGFVFLVINNTAIFVDENTGSDHYYTIFCDGVQYVVRKHYHYSMEGDHGFARALLTSHVKMTLRVENVAFVESDIDTESLKHFSR